MSSARYILFSQHPLCKWAFCLILSFLILVISRAGLFMLFLVVALYFSLYPDIFIYWLNAILRLLPLFIAILIFSLLSGNNFYHDLILIARIIFLLLLSVFLIKTSSIPELFSFLPEKCSDIRQFLTATLLFIPIFITSFTQARKPGRKMTEIFNETLSVTHDQIDNIRSQINSRTGMTQIKYSWKADLTGFAVLVIAGFICLCL